jgi:hypothetical protein
MTQTADNKFVDLLLHHDNQAFIVDFRSNIASFREIVDSLHTIMKTSEFTDYLRNVYIFHLLFLALLIGIVLLTPSMISLAIVSLNKPDYAMFGLHTLMALFFLVIGVPNIIVHVLSLSNYILLFINRDLGIERLLKLGKLYIGEVKLVILNGDNSTIINYEVDIIINRNKKPFKRAIELQYKTRLVTDIKVGDKVTVLYLDEFINCLL